jgi:DNA-binding phage protein
MRGLGAPELQDCVLCRGFQTLLMMGKYMLPSVEVERSMALTRDFRETVQARVRSDAKFRRGLLSDAVESLLAGEAALGREILRHFINATLGFPALAEKTGIHVKTLHQMFGPKGNPTATNLFNIIACLQEHEGVRLQVVA